MCKSWGRILIDIIMESRIRIGMMPIDNIAFFYLIYQVKQGSVILPVLYGRRFYAPRMQYYDLCTGAFLMYVTVSF